MEDSRDPRCIPDLMEIVREDPIGDVAARAIRALGKIACDEAVDALIECFDVCFDGRHMSKQGRSPFCFHMEISKALRGLTGQSIGIDKDLWRQWRIQDDS